MRPAQLQPDGMHMYMLWRGRAWQRCVSCVASMKCGRGWITLTHRPTTHHLVEYVCWAHAGGMAHVHERRCSIYCHVLGAQIKSNASCSCTMHADECEYRIHVAKRHVHAPWGRHLAPGTDVAA